MGSHDLSFFGNLTEPFHGAFVLTTDEHNLYNTDTQTRDNENNLNITWVFTLFYPTYVYLYVLIYITPEIKHIQYK